MAYFLPPHLQTPSFTHTHKTASTDNIPAKERLLLLISTMQDRLTPLLSLSSPMLGLIWASQLRCLLWALGAQEGSSLVSPGLGSRGWGAYLLVNIFWHWALGWELKFHANAKTLRLSLDEYLGLWPISEGHPGFLWWRSCSQIIKQKAHGLTQLCDWMLTHKRTTQRKGSPGG